MRFRLDNPRTVCILDDWHAGMQIMYEDIDREE